MNSSIFYHHPTPLPLPSKRHHSISAASLRRHFRRNLLKKPLPTTTPPPLPTSSPLTSSTDLYIPLPLSPFKTHLNRFISSSQDAFQDLKTLITFDNTQHNYNTPYNTYTYSYDDRNSTAPRRLVVSCKRSTVEFIGWVLISSFVIVYAFRAVLKIGEVLFFGWGRSRGGEGRVVYKRDRSLGGKLVAVGSSDGRDSGYVNEKRDDGGIWDWGDDVKEWRRERGKVGRLPKWWPKEIVGSGIGGMLDQEEKEEYQKQANRFIRGCLFIHALLLKPLPS